MFTLFIAFLSILAWLTILSVLVGVVYTIFSSLILPILKIVLKPILTIFGATVVFSFFAILSPIWLPIFLYYWFCKRDKIPKNPLKNFFHPPTEAEKEIKDLYGASLEEIQQKPQKDYGYRH